MDKQNKKNKKTKKFKKLDKKELKKVKGGVDLYGAINDKFFDGKNEAITPVVNVGKMFGVGFKIKW